MTTLIAVVSLVRAIEGHADGSVRQHDPPMNPKGWRDGS